MSGLVYAGEVRVDKPGQLLNEDSEIIIRGDINKFVSRGGLKLEKALETFETDVNGLSIIDVGASSGGFTDCLLRRGAGHVWAVDVGYGQLAWNLRNDERVTVFERTNIRNLTPDRIGQALDMAVIDVSFISLKLVLPPVKLLLKDNCKVICLIKPQFEAGRELVGKKGVVRSPLIHEQVIEQFAEHAKESGFSVLGLTYSPIRGPEGNIEYLALLGRCHAGQCEGSLIRQIVEEAHSCL
jgi:23S rRNA (cytidine1920-2'-O)/16S rRNA (cytidine1409-2'-O)-methyltransferase